MKRALYFAFGSNLDERQMRERCPSAKAGPRATLDGHRLVFRGASRRWGGGVATVVRDPERHVEGRVYTLDHADLERLDRFEGCPGAYSRVSRVVRFRNGRRARVHLYVFVDGLQVNPPSKQYFAVIARAYRKLALEPTPLLVAVRAALDEARSRAVRVFVYGSLLSGEPNHRLLAEARRIGPARTAPYFRLVDLGGFPAMVHDGAGHVVGELYEVDRSTLAALDRLEGCPRFYERTVIALADGTEAEAYLLRPEQVRGRTAIPSGDWRGWRRRAS